MSLSTHSALPPFPSDVETVALLVIDHAKLTCQDAEVREAEEERMWQACKQLGFFYLKDPPINPNPMFDLAKETFDLPQEEKDRFDMGVTGRYFGYKKQGAMVLDSRGTLDRSEFYNTSKDSILSSSFSTSHPAPIVQTPDIATFSRTSHSVVQLILGVLSRKLLIPNDSPISLPKLHRYDAPSGDQIRFTRVPPSMVEESQQDLALKEHTDFGSVTILFNRLGGLQILPPSTASSPKPHWTYVRPLPGHAIVNLGDALVKLSAGILRSNLHRVISPPGEQAGLERFSIVYFSRPENDIPLRPLADEGESPLVKEGLQADSTWGQGEVLTAQQWVARRVKNTMAANFKGEESWLLARGTEGMRV